jgi:two-component system osmolarity sensor histidine kinase EnvZ
VRIELADVGLQVETVVIDQGGGFTHPLQALVPFTTTDRYRNRDSGGCGLGLAIAKGIIEAHGGTIAIDEGPGGRVRLVLPSR